MVSAMTRAVVTAVTRAAMTRAAMTRAVRRLGVTTVLAGLLSLALVGLTPRPSYAHAQLTASLPATDAVIGTMPPRVLLTFSDPLDPSRIQVDVLGPDKASVIAGPVSVRGNVAQQPVRPGGNGRYVISYRVISADTHVVTGTVTFTLQPGAPPAPSEPVVVAGRSGSPTLGAGPGAGPATGAQPAAGGAGNSGGGMPWWLWVVPVLAGALAAAVYVWFSRRRRIPSGAPSEGVQPAPEEGVQPAPEEGVQPAQPDEGVQPGQPTEGVQPAEPAEGVPPAPDGDADAPRTE
jgi:methionine-rich copper-binding protein CopC